MADVQDGRIPVAAAKAVAQEHGLRQVLLVGYDGQMVHVVTYGATKEDCEAAAKAQDFWQGHIREFTFSGSTGEGLALKRILDGLWEQDRERERQLDLTYCGRCEAEGGSQERHAHWSDVPHDKDCLYTTAIEAIQHATATTVSEGNQ